MNKQRRQDLDDVTDLLQEACARLEEIKEEESEAFDNLPESLQYSSRGEAMEDAMYRMDLLISDIEDVIANVEKFQAGK
jgi:hypothetical protein